MRRPFVRVALIVLVLLLDRSALPEIPEELVTRRPAGRSNRR